MPFDQKKFTNTDFKDRTADVPVVELKAFFGDGEKCVWVVKCLGANEISIANQAIQSNKDLQAIISALVSEQSVEKADAIKDVMGIHSDDVPDDVVRRISLLVSGSLTPECDQEFAVKLSVA